MTAHVDCVIIGSGFSALSAATKIVADGHTVTLVEARTRPGGRASTYSDGNLTYDQGCAQMHGWNEGTPLRAVADSFGITGHVVQGAQLLVVGDGGILPEAQATALLSNSQKLAFAPATTPSPITSLADALLPTLHSSSLVALARTAEIGAGVSLESLSAKYHGFGRGIGGTDAAPQNGYSEIIDRLVSALQEKGTEVVYGEEVVAVEDMGKGVKVTARSGASWIASHCISTIPLGVLKNSPPTFTPSLSAAYTSALERTDNGVLEKVVIYYSPNDIWWPSPSTVGTYLILPTSTNPSPQSLHELFASITLSVANLSRTSPSSPPALLVYVAASAAKFIANHSADDIGAALHPYLLSRLLPTDTDLSQINRPTKTIVTRWLADPFARGATSAPTTLSKSKDGEMATPLDYVLLSRDEWNGRLGFAGEHTEMDTRGSAAGAWISGEREGNRVAGLLERSARV
ncbi:hypothetical protein P7C70_g357, partial [Phenoliferia sp. Uapishka_3]